MKLALGTVQFGCDYGISNKNGQVKINEIEKILEYAQLKGIDTLDTAQGYGNSEEVLGQFDLSKFKIITKIIGEINLETSLKKLHVNSIYGLMFHRENEINDKTWDIFNNYKTQGLVQKIGISVYTPSVLSNIIDNYNIDIVQLPMNILDQRFVELLPKLKEKNIEVHTRSAFMQGLLLMETHEISEYFKEIKPILNTLPKEKLQSALQFVFNKKEVNKVVVGVTKKSELEEIVNVINKKNLDVDYSKFSIQDERFVLPQNWRI